MVFSDGRLIGDVMSDRPNERSAFLFSLKRVNSTPDWEAYRAQFEGSRTAECVRKADLIRVARGEADEPTERFVRDHAATCAACGTWLAGFERGWNRRSAQGEPGDEPDTFVHWMKEELERRRLASVTLAPHLPDPNTWTSITKLWHQDTERALRAIRSFLPGILDATGLKQALADEFVEFIRRQKPRHLVLRDLLRKFAVECQDSADLPFLPGEVRIADIVGQVVTRELLTQGSRQEDSDTLCAFRTQMLELDIRSPEDLERLSKQAVGRSSLEVCTYIGWFRAAVKRKQDDVLALWRSHMPGGEQAD